MRAYQTLNKIIVGLVSNFAKAKFELSWESICFASRGSGVQLASPPQNNEASCISVSATKNGGSAKGFWRTTLVASTKCKVLRNGKMKLKELGKNSSVVEVTQISLHGIWLLTKDEEFFYRMNVSHGLRMLLYLRFIMLNFCTAFICVGQI